MSPYAFYQFWLNRADEEVPGLLRVFSFRSRGEIEALEQETRDKPAARTGQRALAEEMTTLVHGADETAKAIAASRALFGQGDLAGLDEATLAAALAEIPLHRVPAKVAMAWNVGEGPTVADLMADAGIVPSKSAARRAIAGGGAYLNNRKVTEPDERPAPDALLPGGFLVLRRGKRTLGGVAVERD
jgi:tyrosyl-tRNA synthetase